MFDTAKYHGRLMQRLAALDARQHAIEAELDTPRASDSEDRAVEREGEEVLETLGQTAGLEIARIRAALDRLRKGAYGICTVCDEAISRERLDILPETPMCRTCAAQTA